LVEKRKSITSKDYVDAVHMLVEEWDRYESSRKIMDI